MKDKIHHLVNRERRKHGVPTVRWNPQMTQLAQSQANHCAKVGYMVHSNRFAFQGGEALCGGSGYFSPETIVAGWMGSPSHREYILSLLVKQVGIGVARRNGKMFVAWAFSSIDPNKQSTMTKIITRLKSYFIAN